jgi:hypothetical protein
MSTVFNFPTRDKSKPLRKVYRAMSRENMNKIIDRQKTRGWVPISEIVELSEVNPITGSLEPYRYKVVMEFRGNRS